MNFNNVRLSQAYFLLNKSLFDKDKLALVYDEAFWKPSFH